MAIRNKEEMKMIIQYDEVADHEFSIPEFDMAQYSSMKKFYEGEHANINEAIFNSLCNGIKMKYERVPCFSFLGTEAVITIEKFDYLERLEECLKFFIDHEEFEKCVILQNLKEILCQQIQELSI